MSPRMPRNRITAVAALSLFAGFLILSFIFGNIHDLVFGAPLSIHTITDGTTLSDGFLPITGTAQHARSVLINGRSIALDRSGRFADGVLLSPGYNVVEVALRDQFGKEKVKTYHVVLSENNTVATLPSTDPASL